MGLIDRRGRHKRIAKKLKGSALKPRLVVFRSNKNIYAQLVDDEAKKVITACSTLSQEFSPKDVQASTDKGASGETDKNIKTKNIIAAHVVGKLVAKRALALGIKEICYDRAGYKYHGRVKALADGAREGGLKF